MSYQLTRTKIEWCHVPGYQARSWNPLGQGCTNRSCIDAKGTNYCYARTLARRFGDTVCQQYPTPEQAEQHGLDAAHSLCWNFFPHLHPERLEAPLRAKNPCAIFLQSMGDIFDLNIPQDWRDQIWRVVEQCPQHVFFVLTKQPQNIWGTLPDLESLWMGVTLDGTEQTEGNPSRLIANGTSWRVGGIFVSCEPLLAPWTSANIEVGYVNWVIIGQDSRPGQPRPKVEWVQGIIDQARSLDIPVFLKPPLVDWWVAEGHGEPLQQFPKLKPEVPDDK